jgi:hypothetical protein
MKRTSYFIPLNNILISTKNIKEILDIIPSSKDVSEHILSQYKLKIKNPENKFNSIKIFIKDEEYNNLIDILAKKVGNRNFDKSTIDLILSSETVPVIQILNNGSKKEKR